MTQGTSVPQIGIVGTFDLANYGDLLFPIIAERELGQRLGDFELIRFSYHDRRHPDWPYDTVSLSKLPEMIDRLDALIVGGGHLIRFDTAIAPGYAPPPTIHHPTGYWLTPALLALQHDVPLAWNAPGMHDDEIPDWAEPLMRLAFESSSYTAVRDELTKAGLSSYTDDPIAVVPDTAFGLARCLVEQPSTTFATIRSQLGRDARYLVIQAAPGTRPLAEFVRRHAATFADYRILALPIGPVLGDAFEFVADVPGVMQLPTWPAPLLLAELIAHSEGAIGHSFHLAVTALSAGVPVFRSEPLDHGKFTALADFGEIAITTIDPADDADRIASRLGRGPVSPAIDGRLAALAEHWDRIADVVRCGRTRTSVQLNRFWQRVPATLEEGERSLAAQRTVGLQLLAEAKQLAAASAATLQEQAEELHAEMFRRSQAAETEMRHRAEELHAEMFRRGQAAETEMRHRAEELHAEMFRRAQAMEAVELGHRALIGQLATRDTMLARTRHAWAEVLDESDALVASHSWRITAPLRWVSGRLRRSEDSRPVLRIPAVLRSEMQTAPFEWATVNGLFTPTDAAALARSYPRTHFTTVIGDDGEKAYKYEARALLSMGSNVPTHAAALSDSWRRLAADVASPAYRTAMSLLTGIDLSDCPIEANVFHYGPRASLGAHKDLADKVVTHVLYFNETWDPADGGCLLVLASPDESDVAAVVPPIVGTSAVIVRSGCSWHAVSPVVGASPSSRRSVAVTFYRPGSASTMWPPGATPTLHDYSGPN